MSESGDYNPGPWRGYDFDDARKVYDRHVGRSYNDAVRSNRDADSLVPKSISTKSESPLVIACDVTGSMGEWPVTMFSKLPYLELEAKEYLGNTMKISWAAIGDAYTDTYPLQVRKFTSGRGLEKELKSLVIEGRGGNQKRESYELTALYYARKVNINNAINPVFIFIGDEALYENVNKSQARKWAHTVTPDKMTSEDAIDELKRKWSVYLVRKPYQSIRGGLLSSIDEKIQSQWENYLGEDHVALLGDPHRVVDVIFGILAQHTSRVPYFRDELTQRQTQEQATIVMQSLHTIHDGRRRRKSMGASRNSIMLELPERKIESLL